MSPSTGHFVLYSSFEPALRAGRHVLTGDAEMTVGGDEELATDQYRAEIEVTAPRFLMPPDQMLSTFPPANAVGSFELRLPQVVLKQRTLPWARDPGDDVTPWLALVVLAETEATFVKNVPVAACVSPGVTLAGRSDVATGGCVRVMQSVVDSIFPTVEDVRLLAHVREVDLGDTELALGDDDGFLAVVMANRLPQFDRATGKPVAYRACLISLEGQLDVLPTAADFPIVDEVVVDPRLFENIQLALASGLELASDVVLDAGAATSVSAMTVALDDSVSAASFGLAEAVLADPGNELVAPEIITRLGLRTFPVLAEWSFTCSGNGDFESLMRDLDVGLLGTEPADNEDDVPGGAELEVVESGHIGLDHLTRRGHNARAWYRGPLSPHRIVREAEQDGRLPLAHTSDQLRSVTPGGRENLTRSSAFEIGRLLALSNPAVVEALMRWRREQFGKARLGQSGGRLGRVFDLSGVDVSTLITRIGLGIVDVIANPTPAFPRPVPLVPIGPIFDFAPRDPVEWIDVVGGGLGLPTDIFEEPFSNPVSAGRLGDLIGTLENFSQPSFEATPAVASDVLDAAIIDSIVTAANRLAVDSPALSDSTAELSLSETPLFEALIDDPIDVSILGTGPLAGGLVLDLDRDVVVDLDDDLDLGRDLSIDRPGGGS